MKVTTFVQLVLQVAEINNHLYCNKNNNPDGLASLNGNNNHYRDELSTARTVDSTISQRSTFQGSVNYLIFHCTFILKTKYFSN